MTYMEAAIAVLRDHGHPMTTREITEEALRRGLLGNAGKTPEASMSSRLYVHAKRGNRRGLVRLHEPGASRAHRDSVRWGLSEWGLSS